MASTPRKGWILRIKEILERYSDQSNPLTQKKIIEYLKKDYGITCERKAVARNITKLQEMGYDIVSNRKGTYLVEKEFTDSELRLLIDSVMCSRHINPKHSKDLINKLTALGGVSFCNFAKHISYSANWDKSANLDFFLNIEIFHEAISNSLQVAFYYNKYGIDKKLKRKSLHKRIVNPYGMVLHNQRYYLMGNDSRYENLLFYRIDKITRPTLLDTSLRHLDTLPSYEQGLDVGRLTTCHPYLYVDSPQEITLLCADWMVDEIIDWFGKDFAVKRVNEKQIEIAISAAPRAIIFWLLQYGEHVEVLSPLSLREELKKKLDAIVQKYN